MSYTYLQHKSRQYVIDYVTEYLPNCYTMYEINSNIFLENPEGYYEYLDLGVLGREINILEFKFNYMIYHLLQPIFKIYGLHTEIQKINGLKIIISFGTRKVNIKIYNGLRNSWLSMNDEFIIDRDGFSSSLLLLIDPILCINQKIQEMLSRTSSSKIIDKINNSNILNIPLIIKANTHNTLTKYLLFKIYFNNNCLPIDILNVVINNLILIICTELSDY